MSTIASTVEGLLRLFYPHLCLGCGNDNLEKEEYLCIRCINSLPRTDNIYYPHNSTEQIFSGRLDIQFGHSEFYFSKGKIIQQILHQLKYKGNKDVGIFLGELLGKTLLNSERSALVDAIVPLPMHHHKELKRGYNQAAVIAQGVSNMMKKPVLEKALVRVRATNTQTKMHRAERWTNVDGSFSVQQPELIEGNNILLIDDVITTGATLEACGRELLKVKNVGLSIATVAIAARV